MRFTNHPEREAGEYGRKILNYLESHSNGRRYFASTERQIVEFGNLRHTDVFEIRQPGNVMRLWIPKTVVKIEINVPYEGIGHGKVHADRKLMPEEKLKTIVESIRANGF